MWSIRNIDSYSDELKQVIAIITNGQYSKGAKTNERLPEKAGKN